MELNSAVLKRNAGLIYGTIILLGVILSSYVYVASQQIKQNTLVLIDEEIKIFEQLQHLERLFVEQELFLNEYYANQNRQRYLQSFIETADKIKFNLKKLQSTGVSLEQITQLSDIQHKTVTLAAEFDTNMAHGDPNSGEMWDTARSHLEMLTAYRQQIKPVFSAIISNTNQRISSQYNSTIWSLDQMLHTVLLYSGLIVIIAFFVGRAIRTSIRLSIKNRRLALFPERNPNPILSLDGKNAVKYINPSMSELLTQLNLAIDLFVAYFSADLLAKQDQIKNEQLTHAKIDIEFDSLSLECDIHWLQDIDSWDLHFFDVTEKKATEHQLQFQAYHDQETGLFNKNQLYLDVEKICLQSQKHAIGLLEIRDFSQLVSRLGLQQTEVVIKQLANCLQTQMNDIVEPDTFRLYRTTEKQFGLCLQLADSNIKIAELVVQLERIIEAQIFENNVNLALDFGFSCYPKHADNVQNLLKSATIALDAAIKIEHASVVVYSESLGELIIKELELVDKLRTAIDLEHLQLYFQPQLNIKKNQIIGVETLLRWPTECGFIAPVEFIPLAEKTGLIIPLGNWILLQACLKAAELVNQGHSDIVVAINISPQQFNHPSFYEMVIGVLAQSQVPASNIELEITEGVTMYNESDTIALLHKLKALGLKLSIDDFGTGYSSLSYLKQFPIDKLKIDQSFIKQIEQNEEDKAIVSTVINLGNNLGLTLIAEGVEEQSHLQILEQLGCQEIQGYYFSRPLPSDQLTQFLLEFNAAQQQNRHLR